MDNKSSAKKPKRCYHCEKVVDKLYKCKECKRIKYCSVECQLKDWKTHSKCCDVGKRLSESISEASGKKELVDLLLILSSTLDKKEGFRGLLIISIIMIEPVEYNIRVAFLLTEEYIKLAEKAPHLQEHLGTSTLIIWRVFTVR